MRTVDCNAHASKRCTTLARQTVCPVNNRVLHIPPLLPLFCFSSSSPAPWPAFERGCVASTLSRPRRVLPCECRADQRQTLARCDVVNKDTMQTPSACFLSWSISLSFCFQVITLRYMLICGGGKWDCLLSYGGHTA